jgi:hypothetical protein
MALTLSGAGFLKWFGVIGRLLKALILVGCLVYTGGMHAQGLPGQISVLLALLLRRFGTPPRPTGLAPERQLS